MMKKRAISPGLSVYLDLIRFGAAFTVVMSHVWSLLFPSMRLPWPGHSAVVVFFVMSGFLISQAAHAGLGLHRYAYHRIARIYPVVLGAVVLSIAVSPITAGHRIEFAGSRGSDTLDILLNMAFLGQSWMDVALPLNAPFWSLNYEVWYYILFGLWCYHPSRLLLLVAALIAGPKILMLMPVWLLGVLLHRRMIELDRSLALQLFLASLAAGLAFFWFDAGIRIREAMRGQWPALIEHARGSNQFVGDFILGVIVSINFLAAASLRMSLLRKHEKAIRFLASFTFSMYLFHMPLTALIWYGFGIHSALLYFGLLVIGIAAMGQLTERRVEWYRSLLGKLTTRRGSMLFDVSTATASELRDPLCDSPAGESGRNV